MAALNASHLYLGFVDGGLIGFYDDNLGALSVNYEIHNIANEPQKEHKK